jgi:GT2 family glycosyltransferase
LRRKENLSTETTNTVNEKNQKKYDVSIIIVNFKTFALVDNCIKTIYEKTSGLSFEVVIVDNSNDSSEFRRLMSLSQKYPLPISVINARANLGFGQANNLGALSSNAHYLLFLNSDTILINNAIYEMKKVFLENNNVGCVGANLFTLDGKPQHSYIKNELNKKGIQKNYSLATGIARKFGNNDQFNKTGKILDIKGYLTGACLLVPVTIFNEIGGFNKDIFMYGEDNLFCGLVMRKGYRLINTPKAKVIHLNGASDSTIYSDKKITSIVKGNSVCIKELYGAAALPSYLLVYYKSLKKRAFWDSIIGKRNDSKNLSSLANAYKREFEKITKEKVGMGQ